MHLCSRTFFLQHVVDSSVLQPSNASTGSPGTQHDLLFLLRSVCGDGAFTASVKLSCRSRHAEEAFRFQQ
ncbi:hypothetical protein F7725_008405, partial [Dissostichus mawsoni]